MRIVRGRGAAPPVARGPRPLRIRTALAHTQRDPEVLFWSIAPARAKHRWESFGGAGVSEQVFWLDSTRPRLLLTYYHAWEGWVRDRDDPRTMLRLASVPFFLAMLISVF